MNRTLVLAFGRISIVTIGHMKLISKMDELAKEFNGDALLCLSKSFDNVKNPISFDDKSSIFKNLAERTTEIIGKIIGEYGIKSSILLCLFPKPRK